MVATFARSDAPALAAIAAGGALGSSLRGFTTFSTFGVEVRTLLESGRTVSALGYLGGTVVASVGAVVIGAGATRWWRRTGTGTAKGGRR
ncbi:camphor resistance protein CrcB [Nocardia otitidiscaviarum]|uniref:Camphor resistance protein CrcB n=1 Tax=Nocardia otitidiscaviarum TaxID=1823 RepID=A0A379JHW0_9NOCA|nr:CrcB family protein [Nocardia otitidiscaviarum]MBF6177727.1 CrcB family protein [Nocardia otitidiscaviarum]SUD47851.1 camphor resistance protein CrcB [Nocardia otitidiscaviarum]